MFGGEREIFRRLVYSFYHVRSDRVDVAEIRAGNRETKDAGRRRIYFRKRRVREKREINKGSTVKEDGHYGTDCTTP